MSREWAPRPPLPALLKRHMELARGVILKVRSAVPNSSNYEVTSSPIRAPKGPPPPEVKAAAEIKLPVDHRPKKFLYKVNEAAYELKKAELQKDIGRPHTNQDWLDSAKKVKAHCSEYHFGNCGELALMAAGAFYEIGPRNIDYIQISTVALPGPAPPAPVDARVLPHVICVIGRVELDPNLNRDGAFISTPDTWGADAVICDAWDRAAYPAADFNAFWGGIRTAANGNAITCQLLHRFT